MRHLDATARRLEMRGNGVGNEYGPMPPAGAANGDCDVRLAFLFILRNKVVEKAPQMTKKYPGLFLGSHVFDDGRVRTGQAFQVRLKVGVRQEPDVKYQVGIDGRAVLESKTHQ